MKKFLIISLLLNANWLSWGQFISIGSVVAKANGIASDPVVFSTTADVERENTVFCAFASDNDGDGTDTNDIISATFGTTAMSIAENEADTGAAAAGAVVGLFEMNPSSTIVAGTTIVVDMAASRAGHAISCWTFDISPTIISGIATTQAKEDITVDAGIIQGTAPGGTVHRPNQWLYVRAIASETTNASIATPTSGWSVFTSSTASTGTEATSMGIAAEFIVSHSTFAISDPTMSDVTADRASVISGMELVFPTHTNDLTIAQ